MLEVMGLVKRYDDVLALDGCNLTVPAGHLVGLLGPNGAGKTTVMRTLAGRADSRVDRLSHGNQQRIQLAVALVHDPDLLVLDEPFAGLDPIAVDALAALLHELCEAGTTVLFSSHQLDLVQDLCEDVAILDHGRVVLAGRLSELRVGAPQR